MFIYFFDLVNSEFIKEITSSDGRHYTLKLVDQKKLNEKDLNLGVQSYQLAKCCKSTHPLIKSWQDNLNIILKQIEPLKKEADTLNEFQQFFAYVSSSSIRDCKNLRTVDVQCRMRLGRNVVQILADNFKLMEQYKHTNQVLADHMGEILFYCLGRLYNSKDNYGDDQFDKRFWKILPYGEFVNTFVSKINNEGFLNSCFEYEERAQYAPIPLSKLEGLEAEGKLEKFKNKEKEKRKKSESDSYLEKLSECSEALMLHAAKLEQQAGVKRLDAHKVSHDIIELLIKIDFDFSNIIAVLQHQLSHLEEKSNKRKQNDDFEDVESLKKHHKDLEKVTNGKDGDNDVFW